MGEQDEQGQIEISSDAYVQALEQEMTEARQMIARYRAAIITLQAKTAAAAAE